MKYTSMMKNIVMARLDLNQQAVKNLYGRAYEHLSARIKDRNLNPNLLPYMLPITSLFTLPGDKKFLLCLDRGPDAVGTTETVHTILRAGHGRSIYIAQNTFDYTQADTSVEKAYAAYDQKEYFRTQCVNLTHVLESIFENAYKSYQRENSFSCWYDPDRLNLYIYLPNQLYTHDQLGCNPSTHALFRALMLASFVFAEQVAKTEEQTILIENTFSILADENTKQDEVLRQALENNAKLYTDLFEVNTGEYERLFEEVSNLMSTQFNERLKTLIKDAEYEYEHHFNSACEALEKRSAAMKELGTSFSQQFQFNNFLSVLEKYPAIDDFAINGSEIHLRVTAPMTIDSSLLRYAEKNIYSHYELFKAVAENKVTLYFQQEVYFDISNQEYLLNAVRPSSGVQMCTTPVGKKTYPNPHLDSYNCFGSFRMPFAQAVRSSNFHAMFQLIINTVSQLNLADGPVVGRFTNTSYVITRNSDGREMDFREYIREEKQREENTNNQ